jgi:F-type H+-transporting ATPase subunit beta
MSKGEIKQVIGPVVDVYFPEEVPAIQTALRIPRENEDDLVLEVAQHIGLNRVRTIAMADTAGLHRGMSVESTGTSIYVPVGDTSLGQLLNVLGDTINGKDALPEKT